MSGSLALVGGGEWTDGCTFDAGLVAESGADEVVVLPTGSAYERPGELVVTATRWFEGLGVRVVEAPVLGRTDGFVPETVELVRSARFVYLAGASAMHLRSVLKDSPLWDALVAAWEGGAVLAGTGAGADVLCDPMVDPRGGAFTVGLGLLEGMAVIPRVDTWSEEKVHRTVSLARPGLVVVGLPTATALIRSPERTWRSEGVGDVTVHVGGEPATLADLPA